MRARLLRAIPKSSPSSRARPRGRARVPGDPAACGGAGGRDDSASFDGFRMDVAANGDVTMSVNASSGYVVQVFVGGALPCSDLDLPECPTADGQLRGTDGRKSALGLRITQNGNLVQSLRTTVRSTQKLSGLVAEDAKLDEMSLEDVANESTVFQVPQGTVRLRLSVLRTVKLNMRSGAFIASPRVRVGFGFGGQSQGEASAAAAQAARAYEQSFPDLFREERDNYRRREQIWQGPGRCAKVTFSPATDSMEVQPGDAARSRRRSSPTRAAPRPRRSGRARHRSTAPSPRRRPRCRRRRSRTP